jgi:hypothetical protein
MPGGDLEIEVFPDFSLALLGPVRHVADGRLSRELIEEGGP